MTVVIIVFAVYYLLLLTLMIGWQRALRRDFPIHHRHFMISVIVPFRNEEDVLSPVIHSLITQTYNHQFFEVLLINDHSTDASEQKVIDAIRGLVNFKLIQTDGNGKKQALRSGIDQAVGEIIVTTDADCTIPENWLARINHTFQEPSIKMAFGGVAIRGQHSFFSGLQAMEFSSLVGSAAATAGLGSPILCNGASLAFLKSTFYEVHGYDDNLNVPSGDDEFLLRKILEKHSDGIAFLNTGDAVVSTRPQPSVRDFISQRIRWAGKWRYNSSAKAQATAIFILLFQLSFTGLIIAVVADTSIAPTALPLIGVKLVLEFIFLFQCCSFLGLRWRTIHFLALQLLYPFYVIYIGIAANFISYEWKGRRWNHGSAVKNPQV